MTMRDFFRWITAENGEISMWKFRFEDCTVERIASNFTSVAIVAL